MKSRPLSLAARLGARIRQRRTTVGLSQLALAEAAGLSLNFVGAMERGEHLPRLETLGTLARVLRTTSSDLLREDEALPRPERDAWAAELYALAKRLPRAKRDVLLTIARALVQPKRAKR